MTIVEVAISAGLAGYAVGTHMERARASLQMMKLWKKAAKAREKTIELMEAELEETRETLKDMDAMLGDENDDEEDLRARLSAVKTLVEEEGGEKLKRGLLSILSEGEENDERDVEDAD